MLCYASLMSRSLSRDQNIPTNVIRLCSPDDHDQADKLEHFLILFLLFSKLMHFTSFQISRFPSLIAPRGLLASDAWMGPANLVSFRIPGHPRRNCRTVLMEVRSFQVIVATGFVFAFSMDDDSIHAPRALATELE